MRNRKFIYGLVAVIFFFVCLIATMPAAWLFNRVLHDNASVSAYGVSGTVWNGQAQQLLVNISGANVPLGRTHWRLQPWSFLLLSPALSFDSEYGKQFIAGHAKGSLSGKVTINELRGLLPVALIKNWLPLPMAGDVTLRLDKVAFKHDKVTALDGNVQLQQLALVMPTGEEVLGSYLIDLALHKENEQIQADISTLEGELSASGSLKLMQGERQYHADIVMEYSESVSKVVTNTLFLWAKPHGQNRLVLRRSGIW